VLQECMQAVVELEDDDALELLRPYLSHRDQHLAAFAALMIAQTRDPQALSLILETLDRLTGDPLQATILALTAIRTDEAQAALKQLVTSDRKDIKRILTELGIEP
jgi:HEAT repeat protein